mmetsp:Transcript_36501/g.66901  ORF Transcript_36501/g.66901 Transcript_36501/m.66901 type:complete len:213 (+) Transcript_36501:68-706(+)
MTSARLLRPLNWLRGSIWRSDEAVTTHGPKVWNELKHLRHRDLLRRSLLRAYERDQLESRVIQSKAFLPLLTKWTEVMLQQQQSCLEADPSSVPKEVQEQAASSKNPQVRWLVKRLMSGESLHRGPPHFPSVLLQRGPQFPFEPHELLYLRQHADTLKGTELTKPVELPEQPEQDPAAGGGQPDVPPRDLWAEGCLDDDDFIDHRKAPFGAM